MDLFKDLVPDLLQHKKGLITSENEKEYNPYITNQALSYHMDCIIHVNEININSHLDKKMQHDYYLYALRGYKRPYKQWVKETKSQDLEPIKVFFKCSITKAKEILSLINKEQLDKIKQIVTIGGR